MQHKKPVGCFSSSFDRRRDLGSLPLSPPQPSRLPRAATGLGPSSSAHPSRGHLPVADRHGGSSPSPTWTGRPRYPYSSGHEEVPLHRRAADLRARRRHVARSWRRHPQVNARLPVRNPSSASRKLAGSRASIRPRRQQGRLWDTPHPACRSRNRTHLSPIENRGPEVRLFPSFLNEQANQSWGRARASRPTAARLFAFRFNR